jgi:Holliday junction resolvase
MTEATIQKAILDYLKSLGAWCFAFKASICNERGVPDIICCYKGRFIGLEVKTARGRPSSIQKAQIRRINCAMGKAKVVRSVEEVKEVLNTLEGDKLSDDSADSDDDLPDG